MAEDSIPQDSSDVPTQIFEAFLGELTDAGISPEVVARLRKAIVEDRKTSEPVLRAAILNDEQPQ